MTAQEKIHAYLDDRQVCLKDFAAECGVAYTTLVAIHRRNDGVWFSRMSTIMAICNRMRIRPDDFVDEGFSLDDAQRRFQTEHTPVSADALTVNEIEMLARFRMLDKRSQLKEIGRLEALTNIEE